MKIFDLIIIGSGPNAIAALSEFVNISTNLRIAIISGAEEPTTFQYSGLHQKIDSIARERNEQVGAVNPRKFENLKKGSIFSTASIGGLGNYWGQQFLRYEKNDFWPKDIFDHFKDYLDHIFENNDVIIFNKSIISSDKTCHIKDSIIINKKDINFYALLKKFEKQ